MVAAAADPATMPILFDPTLEAAVSVAFLESAELTVAVEAVDAVVDDVVTCVVAVAFEVELTLEVVDAVMGMREE
jgi:hypothetical protein